jgi:RNA polymerase sigma factor (sigma-70 family)
VFGVDSRNRFEALYRAHCGAVRSFVHRRVPPGAADDVVADVFVIVWRRLDEAPTSDGLPWMIGIARGVLANRRRVEARRLALRDRLAANILVDGQPGPDEPSEGTEVRRALASLSARDQEVLLLVTWDGLDRAQAAKALGISASGFAVRLHRARRRFARALAAQGLEQRQAGESPAVEAL